MKRSVVALVAPLILAVGLPSQAMISAAPAPAAPRHTDAAEESFLDALTNAGIAVPDRRSAVKLGKSLCPRLSEPGQNAADLAASVADTAGMPLGPSTRFTGLAITIFCPALISRLGKDTLPKHRLPKPRR